MAQTIQTPAGPAEFPDGMPMADIEAVLRKQFPPEKPKSIVDRFVGFADDAAHAAQNLTGKFGRPAMEAFGGTLGGVLAAPAAVAAGIPSGGTGAAAVEAGGVGSGTALGGHYYDVARDYFTGSKSPPLADQAQQAAQDFSAGAAFVPGGRLVGAGLAKAVPLAKAGALQIANVLDAGAKTTAESVRAAALAKVLAQQQAAAATATGAATAKAADVDLRAAMKAAADAQAERGVGVGDIPEAQQLVDTLRARQSPNGPVATLPTKDQNAVYQNIIDTLAPSSGPKPDLETVQNLRRLIAKPAYAGGDLQGAAAIDKIERRNLVRALSGVEDAYTSGASQPVRENWALAKTLMEQAEDAKRFAPELATSAAKLDVLSPTESVKAARSIVDKMAKRNLISDDEYRDFLRMADDAVTAQGKAKFRQRIALAAGTLAGLGSVTGHALHVLP